MKNLSPIQFPLQPLTVHVANLTLKGCSSYYKYMRKENDFKNVLEQRESKWHTELGKIFSTTHWNKTYQCLSNIKNDNRLKWMQFQIVRNCLFTNVRVNKFTSTVSPSCSYCKDAPELISHLYYHCPIVLNFWQDLKNFFSKFGVSIPLSDTAILFGYHEEHPWTVVNMIILWAKHYIWVNKFKNTHLSILAFKAILKTRLKEIKELSEYYTNFSNQFNKWLPIYSSLDSDN